MIGFIGGTGKQGKALAVRLALSGHGVILGSRSPEKAKNLIFSLKQDHPDINIMSGTNREAAEKGRIVFITLPYDTMKTTIKPLKKFLKGKIVVDVINPLSKNNSKKGISASVELQNMLDNSKVVSAFKNISSSLICQYNEELKVDSIVCSDHDDAKKEIIELSVSIGIPAIDGDGLENSLACELLTKLLLQLNKKYDSETGIKILSYKT